MQSSAEEGREREGEKKGQKDFWKTTLRCNINNNNNNNTLYTVEVLGSCVL